MSLPSTDGQENSLDERTELSFSQAVQVNPATLLKRGENYPFVDMAAVNPDSRSAYQSEIRPFKGSGSRFQHGDTLMARITPCLENGKIARYSAPEGTKEGHGSTEFIVIRGRDGVTDNDFAYYLTQWEEVRNYAIGQMTGTSGRQRVPAESLNHLVVPIPPLEEQKAIAHVLGTLDDKIELNRRMNRTLEEMARAIFQDLFVDFGPTWAKMEGQEPYLFAGTVGPVPRRTGRLGTGGDTERVGSEGTGGCCTNPERGNSPHIGICLLGWCHPLVHREGRS